MRLTRYVAITLLVLTTLISPGTFAQEEEKKNPDPLEPMNRKLFALHNWIDLRFFRPLAVTYRAIVPTPVRKSVNNVFANADEIPITVNNLLQGEPRRAAASARRLLINSTIGIAGIFDPATRMGYERERADFGQTMAHWGWKNSSYVFVPLFGPTTTRDGIGIVADLYMTPWVYLGTEVEWTAAGIYALNQRSKFIETEGIVAVAALDEYTFIRDGYLANRKVFVSGETEADVDDTQEDWGDIL